MTLTQTMRNILFTVFVLCTVFSVTDRALALEETASGRGQSFGCIDTAGIRVAAYYGDRRAALVYTFDDGLQEHYTMVFRELKKRGLKATFGIIGSKVGRDIKGTPCLTWANLREMAADGQEIANHGWEHRNVTVLDPEALRHEIERNDSVISDSVGIMPLTYIYPGNRKSEAAVWRCEAGRVGSRLAQVSMGGKRDSAWMRRWVDRLLQDGGWGVAMTHGITVGYDAIGDPSRFWTHLDYVCSLRDSLWVATLADVTAYLREYGDVRLDIEQRGDGVAVTPHLGLDRHIYNHPLTLVVPSRYPLWALQGGRRLYVKMHGGNAVIDFDPNGGELLLNLKY